MSFIKKVNERYSIKAESMGEAAEKLGLDTGKIDFSVPQDFFDAMLKIYPGKHWAGVWSYEDLPAGKSVFGYPRPLTKEAQEMLKKYNGHYKTHYPVNHKVLD